MEERADGRQSEKNEMPSFRDDLALRIVEEVSCASDCTSVVCLTDHTDSRQCFQLFMITVRCASVS